MYCRCYRLCNRDVEVCSDVCLYNVMFLKLNEDRDFEIRTSQITNRTKRHKRRHLKQNKTKQKKKNYQLRQEPLQLHAWGPVNSYLTASTIRQIFNDLYVWVCFECKRMCAGATSSSVPPLRPPPLRHHDRLCHMTGREPEVDRTMLLVLAISFRDNKRQQKGFQRKYSSIALYPLNLGYWFKYETCTPQEK